MSHARRPHRPTLGVAAALAALALTLAGCDSATAHGSSDGKSGPSATASRPASGMPATPRTTAEGRTTLPPWDAPEDVSERVAAAGLPMLGAEGQVMHIHAHLDVIVDGRPVAVPANIGIDEENDAISPLHTHDTTGVIHIESPEKTTFTLGQFMTEWDVALDRGRIGGLTTGGGNELHAYVNGREVNGDPAAITLSAHDEIALVYGPHTAAVKVPRGYNWPSGL